MLFGRPAGGPAGYPCGLCSACAVPMLASFAQIDGYQFCLGAPTAGAMLTRRLNVHQLQPIYEQADKGKALSAGQSCGPIRSIEQLAMRIGNEQ